MAGTQAQPQVSPYGAALDAEYDALPEAIKGSVTIREFAWMDPGRRARLHEDFTMPEPTED